MPIITSVAFWVAWKAKPEVLRVEAFTVLENVRVRTPEVRLKLKLRSTGGTVSAANALALRLAGKTGLPLVSLMAPDEMARNVLDVEVAS